MQDRNTGRTARRWITATACSLAMAFPATPAMAAQNGDLSAAASCGAPEIDAWYDSDQSGTYLKVDFSTPPGCGKTRTVHALGAKIWCNPKGKVVYHETIANKRTPTKTLIRALPNKRECPRFYAEATVTYRGTTEAFEDTWHWNWGNYPA